MKSRFDQVRQHSMQDRSKQWRTLQDREQVVHRWRQHHCACNTWYLHMDMAVALGPPSVVPFDRHQSSHATAYCEHRLHLGQQDAAGSVIPRFRQSCQNAAPVPAIRRKAITRRTGCN